MKRAVYLKNGLASLGVASPLVLWILVVQLFHPPTYLLPSPQAVWQLISIQRAVLWHHAQVTFLEAGFAWILAWILGTVTATLMLFFQPFRWMMMPLLLASQAMPIFAIAPLIVVWLGFGWGSKVAVALLMLYFPITLSWDEGFRTTPQKWLDFAQICGATSWKTFLVLRLPFALGRLGPGLKMAAVWAPMGAVIGEWVGASQGLGFLMLDAYAKLEMALVFAALLTLLFISFLFYYLVQIVFQRWVWWEKRGYHVGAF